MFRRADIIYEMERKRSVHALSFEWAEFKPALYCYDPVTEEIEEVDLWRLGFKVGSERFCIGSFRDGKYVPCPERRRVDRFAQCGKCASAFIADQECIFEPKCNGERCDLEFCKREHVVYVAFFGSHFKIGMSSGNRIRQRVIEQGADAFAVISRGRSRREGRELESELSKSLGIKQHVGTRQLLEAIGKCGDSDKIESGFGTMAEKMDALGLKPSKLEFLDRYPISRTIQETPRITPISGMHIGRVNGIKGKYLVYECDDDLYALNLQDVVGRRILL